MRKLVSVVLSLAVLAGFASVSSAAFSQVSKSTYTASISFTAVGSVSASLTLLRVDNPLTVATSIWFDPGEITLGSTAWKRAKVFAVLSSTITSTTGAVQIYTDNRNAAASPQYLLGSTSTAAGLVGVGGFPASSTTLAMCWRIMDSTAVASAGNLDINQGAPSYPDRLWSTTGTNAYPCWIWMTDKVAWGGQPIEPTDYSVIKEGNKGAQHAEATWGLGWTSPDAIYFGANFTSAVTPREYKTNMLMIEAFTE